MSVCLGAERRRPGGRDVGARREAAREFERDHAVGEGPDGAREVLVARGALERRRGARLQAAGNRSRGSGRSVMSRYSCGLASAKAR